MMFCLQDEGLILETLESAGMDAEVATDMVRSFMQTNLPGNKDLTFLFMYSMNYTNFYVLCHLTIMMKLN